MLRFRTALFVCLVFLSAGKADAVTIFAANLTNSQEPGIGPLTTSTGAPRPSSFGTAIFVLNDAQTALSFTATIFNIDVTGTQTPDPNDNLQNAHIHCCALPGSNAVAPGGVVWGFRGQPFNNTSPNDEIDIPFSTGVGGTFSGTWNLPEGNIIGGVQHTLASELPGIFAGLAYINFHTVQFSGGEIRGQIFAASEPQSVSLLGVGLLVLGFVCRRRFRR